MIEGSKQPKARKNKVYGENRTCLEQDCEQVLSKYNKQKYCYVHHKMVIPRVRGRILLYNNEWTSRVCFNRKEPYGKKN